VKHFRVTGYTVPVHKPMSLGLFSIEQTAICQMESMQNKLFTVNDIARDRSWINATLEPAANPLPPAERHSRRECGYSFNVAHIRTVYLEQPLT